MRICMYVHVKYYHYAFWLLHVPVNRDGGQMSLLCADKCLIVMFLSGWFIHSVFIHPCMCVMPLLSNWREVIQGSWKERERGQSLYL